MRFAGETQQDREEVNVHFSYAIPFVPKACGLAVQELELRGTACTASGLLQKMRFFHPLPRGHDP
jgi:hypothetical protein